MSEHKNVADHLGALVGAGIYDIRMIEDEFGAYGFTYNRRTDELEYTPAYGPKRGARLHARSAEKARDQISRDTGFGYVESRADDTLVVDARDIGRAVYRCLTGLKPPSLTMKDRSLGFRADVRAITKHTRTN